MTMKFNPSNPLIQLCLKGMGLEASGELEAAQETFQAAWEQAETDYEKFIVAYQVGIRQKANTDRLHWLQQSLAFSQKVDDEDVKSAYPTLYLAIASCYEELKDAKNAQKNRALAKVYKGKPTDKGPFYHGTKAQLQPGDLLVAGRHSHYESGFVMNHIYFTANINGAGLAASLAKGDGEERVYLIEPTGDFEHDPNVTDKKFPGNLTRSYRSTEPLKVLAEMTDWSKLSPQERQEWEERLAKNTGEIIN